MKPQPRPEDKPPARRFRRRYVLGLLLIGAFLIVNAPWVFAWFYRVYYRRIERLPPAEVREGERLLVLSPHPDDESLACAGMIQQVLAGGGQVYIVWLTSGDGFEWDVQLVERTLRPRGLASLELGRLRMREARSAAEILGVPLQNLYFLGYPDRGLRFLLTEVHRSMPYRSALTGADRVPYAGTVSEGAAYTGENLERDLKKVLDRVRPTLLLAPSPRDTHPDHHATAELARRVLGERAELDKVRYWVVHGGLEWPLPKGLHRDLPLEPPPAGRGLPWERLPLTPEWQQKKLEALRAHHSQMELLSRFMLAFVRTNELYSKRPG